MLTPQRIALLSGQEPVFTFNKDLATFTAGMATRNSGGPFGAGVLVQGKMDGTGIGDTLSFPRGTLINGNWYSNFDPYQGSIVFWITPEWSSGDGVDHYLLYASSANPIRFYVSGAGNMTLRIGGTIQSTPVTWVAGNTYQVTLRWDCKNTIDGTNFQCISVNDVHAFGITTIASPSVDATLYLGSSGISSPSNAIIEGLTIYRRVLSDGSFGHDVGNGDEINLIYAAGAGKDPTEITGSFDVCLCVPTNATPGPLTTGPTNAWSHPHASNILKNGFLNEGYLGSPWSVGFNGTTTKIDCLSDAGLDDLHNAAFTVDGYIRLTGTGTTQFIYSKGVSGDYGWELEVNGTTGALSGWVISDAVKGDSHTVETIVDRKWHHVVMTFNKAGDKKIYISIDGKWCTYSVQIAMTGNIISDAAYKLWLGANNDIDKFFSGAMGWARVSNNVRYTPGTNFVPVRTPPAADANTLAQWNMSEGTGTTVDNIGTIGAAADGTITAGTWTPAWTDEGTPDLNDVSVGLSGTTLINCGSEGTIDNLPAAAFTVEGWVNLSYLTGNNYLYDKGSGNNVGWYVYSDVGNLYAAIRHNAGIVIATISTTIQKDKRPHHIAIMYNDAGTRIITTALDGKMGGVSVAITGTVTDDSARALSIGSRLGANGVAGALGWQRISNNIRYTANFTPPSRFAPPANDANTVRLFAMNEGAGTVITDGSTNAQNGTLSNGIWNNTRDLAVDSPGYQMYNGGHLLYANAANEGIKQTHTGLTPGADYVVRAVMFAGIGHTAQPQLDVYDVTNAALITSLKGDWNNEVVANGTFASDTLWSKQTGWSIPGGNIAHIDGTNITTSSLTQLLANQLNGGVVIGRLYKITYTIGAYASGACNIVCGGSGGVGTTRTADGTYTEYLRCSTGTVVYIVAAIGTHCEISNVSVTFIPEYNHTDVMLCSFELPTAARGAAADCTSISIKLISAAVGVLGIHQCELLNNLLDNPSFTTGAAADPWIPDGWTNGNISPVGAGESTEESTIVHSSGKSIKFSATVTSIKGINKITGLAVGKFSGNGQFIYGSGYLTGLNNNDTLKQTVSNGRLLALKTGNWWQHAMGVGRRGSGLSYFSPAGNSAIGYIDDAYQIALDDVTLTATPASQANSLEGAGIRVDGTDSLSRVTDYKLSATKGIITFSITPRHSLAVDHKFGTAFPYILDLRKDTNNKIQIFDDGAKTFLSVTQGGVTTNVTAVIPWVAGITYLLKLKYTSSNASLYVDNVLQISNNAAISFITGAPTSVLYGRDTSNNQIDAVFS
jgi:hypothetical protein